MQVHFIIFLIVTTAKLSEKAEENEEFIPLPASKLRQRLAAQSANTEKKYAGRKISRTKLADLDSGRKSNVVDIW